MKKNTEPTSTSSTIQEIVEEFRTHRLQPKSLEILELVVPQVEAFRSAIGVRRERRALYVRWTDVDGTTGYGECSCRPDPFFSGEFVDGAVLVLQDHLAPLLSNLSGEFTLGALEVALRRVRGWPFTLAAVLDAACDLLRRRGIEDPFDQWPGERLRRVPVGISLGLFETEDEAVDRVRRAVDDGYHRVKLKVSPGMRVETLVAIRDAFPTLYLGFDANGSCSGEDLPFLRTLAALEPAMMEQPFPPDRLDLCGELREMPICLDESVRGVGDVVVAQKLGILDEVNLKPGRVGGPFKTLEILAWCADNSVPVWVGGMFETGIGRFANLRVAARLTGAKAHDLSPSSRYFTRDVVQEPLTMDENGRIDLGSEEPQKIDQEALDSMTVRRVSLLS